MTTYEDVPKCDKCGDCYTSLYTEIDTKVKVIPLNKKLCSKCLKEVNFKDLLIENEAELLKDELSRKSIY